MARTFQDDLIAVNSARLRALGIIRPNAASAVICFGDGADGFKREVKLWHRVWSHGRGISLFICPECRQKAQLLKLFDGRIQCRNCLLRLGVMFKSSYGSKEERTEARAKRLEKLRAVLAGGSLRVHPRGGRGIERRRSLTLSLRRGLVREQEGLVKEVEKWGGLPAR